MAMLIRGVLPLAMGDPVNGPSMRFVRIRVEGIDDVQRLSAQRPPGYFHPMAEERFNQILETIRRRRDESCLFPEPNRLGRHPTAFAQISDAHIRNARPLDIPVHGKA